TRSTCRRCPRWPPRSSSDCSRGWPRRRIVAAASGCDHDRRSIAERSALRRADRCGHDRDASRARGARPQPGAEPSEVPSVRFNVYGRFTLDVIREGDQWSAYRLEPGKRIKVREYVIPSSLREAEIGTFLDDIYHELARPGQTVQLEP